MNSSDQALQIPSSSLRPAHIRILFVASLGQFLGQGLSTLVGVLIPLLQMTLHSPLSSVIQGLLGCVSLIGIMIGSAIIGHLSDRHGYLFLFRLCPLVCGLSAAAVIIFPHVFILLPALFLMGVAVGGEYSLDPVYISELMPPRWKVFMVGFAKAFASVGSVIVAAICYVALTRDPNADLWPRLMWIIVGICTLMFIMRLRFAESPAWLVEHGHSDKAQKAVKKFFGQNAVLTPSTISNASPPKTHISLFKFVLGHLRQIILTGLPWACEGLGVYGIGIFMPVLIMAFGIEPHHIGGSPIDRVAQSVWLTFILCLVMMAGFGAGLVILKRTNHLHVQVWGFVISSAGLIVMLIAYLFHWPSWIAIGGFVLFEMALNAGPHLITFILPSQIFNVSDRGTGSGIAASVGKTGAVIGAFMIPVILDRWGAIGVLLVSIIVMLLGAAVTRLFAPSVPQP